MYKFTLVLLTILSLQSTTLALTPAQKKHNELARIRKIQQATAQKHYNMKIKEISNANAIKTSYYTDNWGCLYRSHSFDVKLVQVGTHCMLFVDGEVYN